MPILGGQAGKLRQYCPIAPLGGQRLQLAQGASLFRLRKREALTSTTWGGARVLEASATCMHACSRRRGRRCSRCGEWVRIHPHLDHLPSVPPSFYPDRHPSP